MRNFFRTIQACILALCSIAVACPTLAASTADGFPSKPITIIVPYTPGGTTDLLARMVAESISRETGQPVVVDNRPGAGGSIAGKMVVRAPADGYTLLMTSSGVNSLTPVVFKDFDAMNGLTQVSVLVDVPFIVSVNKSFAAQDMQSFVDYAKNNPGKVTIGNASPGSHGHLAQLQFAKAAAIDVTPVSYKGSVPSLNDVLGGHIEANIDNVGVMKPYIDSNKVTALFVTSPERSASVPQVPTAKELGLDFTAQAWFGLAAPHGTPPEIVAKIQTLAAKGFQQQAPRDKLVQAGLTPVFGPPDEANVRMQEESRVLGKLAASLNLSSN